MTLTSMTGFAQHSTHLTEGTLTWVLRSVNHRFLEINCRLPENFRALEMDCRKLLQAKLHRGKVDATLSFTPTLTDTTLPINQKALDTLAHWHQQVGKTLTPLAPLDFFKVLAFPSVQTLTDHSEIFAALKASTLKALESAIVELQKMRTTEGQSLQKALLERTQTLQNHLNLLKDEQDRALLAQRERLLAILQEAKLNVDEARLAQELVYLAERHDIAEELERIHIHSHELIQTLTTEGSVGKKLDFLLQELHRETNTLAVKAASSVINKTALDMKVCIEQLREQVQNVE